VGVAFFPIILGFGTAGVAAGSIAAATQAVIGNVAAGSLFATTTSFVMSGAAATTITAGAATAVGGGVLRATGN